MMSVRDRLRTSAVIVGICVFGTTVHAQTPGLLDVFDQVWDGVIRYSFAGKPLQQGVVGGGDSLPDVIIGAPGVSVLYPTCEVPPCITATTPGHIYVLFGGPRGPGRFDLTSADTVISGDSVGDRFGAAAVAGNFLNTKGSLPQNLAVSSPKGDDWGLSGTGAVHLFAGGFSNGDSLTTADAVLTILVPGWLIRTLATADLNNDAYGDVIIGAPGRVWVINGSPSLSGLIDLSATPANVTISGTGIGDVIATGDVTGDGVDDLVLGAPESDGLHRGAVYLVYGSSSASLPPTINLPNGANASFLGVDPGDQAGSSVSVADIDADGWRDILVGAWTADGPDNTRQRAGEVYVIWGTGSVVESTNLAGAPVVFFGAAPESFLGSPRIGDINRDAYGDMVFPADFQGSVIYYGRARDSTGVIQPDGRRFVDFSTEGQVDRQIPAGSRSDGSLVLEDADDGAHDIVTSSIWANTPNGQDAGQVYFTNSATLAVSTDALRMSAMQGETATGYFEVRDDSRVEITWEATDDQPWLTYTPTAGSAVDTNAAGVNLTASTAGLAPGLYSATINVASTSRELEKSLPVAVTFGVLSQPTITISPPLPYVAGAPLTFTVGVMGGTGSFEYKFWRFKHGSGWTMVRDYSASPSWTWLVDDGAGDYTVQAWVRTTGSTADWEAWAASPLFTLTTVPSITSLTANTAFPVATGTPITWTVHATGGIPPLHYKFWRFKSGVGWTVAQDWTNSNSHTWTPSPGDSGTYQLQAWVRAASGPGDPDAWIAMHFTVSNSAPLQGQSLTANRSFPSGTGTSITWTAMVSGGTAGPLQYKFWRYNLDTGVWTVVQDYSSLNTWTWVPGYDDPGTYVLQVWVRNTGSSAKHETFLASETWTVTRTPLHIIALTHSVTSPQPSGASVTWTTWATGGSGPLQYQFWLYNAATSTWTLPQPYSAANTFAWTTGPVGTYWIQVWVRTVGSGVDQEAWANSNVFVVQ